MRQPGAHSENEVLCSQDLPELSLGHIARSLKHLPERAAGPDGISRQLLQSAPTGRKA